MMVKTKILVISSDPAMLGFLQQNLVESEYQLVSAPHDEEELGVVLEEEHPDLVILDIMMPGMDGIRICLQIRQVSQVPVMMLSAWGTGGNMVRGLDLSTDTYLTEPFDIDGLIARITESLQRNCTVANFLSSVGLGQP